jgi:PAS domain S-box-containing protein
MTNSQPIWLLVSVALGGLIVGLVAGWASALLLVRRRPARQRTVAAVPSIVGAGRRASDIDRMMAIVPAALYRVENLHTGKPPEFRFFNERIHDLVGYTKSEIESDPALWAELMHPDDRSRYEESEVSEVMRSQRSVLEHRFRHKDGQYRWIRRYVWHVYDHANALRETIGCAVDITDLKNAEEKLRQFLDGSPDPVITTNARGQIVRANAQAQRVFGYPQEALIGHDFAILVAGESNERVMRHFERFAAESKADENREAAVFNCRSKSGSTFPAEIRISQIVTDRERLFAIAIRDVSDRREPDVHPANTDSNEAVGQ